ncbi:MAG: tRNA epoxyqueuosine(34) reductase QueG [Phycisphaerae bacterium]
MKAIRVKRIARELGFDRLRIVRAGPVRNARYYRDWLAAGYAGSMRYLHRNTDCRADSSHILPGARSIICAALSYRRATEKDRLPSRVAARTAGGTAGVGMPPAVPTGRVAQYVRGPDYHLVLRQRLGVLVDHMRAEIDEPFDARVCVDTAPLLERELAAAAGVGWIGKNTLVIDPALGSFLFLGEVVSTLELAPDEPATDHCGTCTRCLDACPTRALVAPYQMDASRCISYLTIEHRGEIPADLRDGIGEWVYGCDVCQDVCPFNAKAPPAHDAEIVREYIPSRLELPQLARLTPGDYKRLVRGTAAGRATRAMWQRNAEIALRNGAERSAGTPSNAT